MIQCLICNRTFKGYRGLSTHIRFHNLNKQEYYDKYLGEKGKCLNCDKFTTFNSLKNGYANYCSLKCSNSSVEVKMKKEQSYLLKFGVINPLQSPKIYKKVKNTCLERYGVENPSQSELIKEKVKHSNISKFGVNYPMINADIKNKSLENKRIKYFKKLLHSNRLQQKCIPNFEIDNYKGTHYKYSWTCNKCGYIFNDHLDDGHIPRCIKCYPHLKGISNLEKEIVKFIESLKIDIIENDRTILSGKELDIYIPSHNLAIEFNGLYWHSEGQGINKNYHLNKTLKCKEKGIQLIHIFEDEWIDKQEIVKSIITAKLGLIQNKIYARKCQLKEVPNDESKLFLFDNHLQSPINGTHMGLYYNDELVSLLTYGKSRFNKNYDYEILRFCNKINTSVTGGLSKLLKHANLNSIITYADLRYGIGNSYLKCGFKLKSKSNPSYYYVNKYCTKKISRFQFQKHLLEDKLNIFDPNLTEWQNMQLNGYDRIWDCGCNIYEVISC